MAEVWCFLRIINRFTALVQISFNSIMNHELYVGMTLIMNYVSPLIVSTCGKNKQDGYPYEWVIITLSVLGHDSCKVKVCTMKHTHTVHIWCLICRMHHLNVRSIYCQFNIYVESICYTAPSIRCTHYIQHICMVILH